MLKIAISGSHGTGKTTICTNIIAKAMASDMIVETVKSPTRDIKKLGFENNKELTWQFEFMVMAEQRKRQLEAQLRAQQRENAYRGRHRSLVISDRCLLDHVSYVAEAIDRREGPELLTADARDTEWLRMFYDLAYQFAMEDVSDFWSYVCYKPPHPDHPPEVDADRLGDRNYQFAVDGHVRSHFNIARLRGTRTVTLDVDRDKAADEVWELVQASIEAPTVS